TINSGVVVWPFSPNCRSWCGLSAAWGGRRENEKEERIPNEGRIGSRERPRLMLGHREKPVWRKSQASGQYGYDVISGEGLAMETGKGEAKKPIRVLLLDDRQDNLILRAAILRSHGYEAVTSASVEDAETHLEGIDIAVLDYHLGAGKFGTEV